MQLSVLLPVRNAATTLPLALSSTLADLRGVNCELICVDDGSRDATPKVLAEFAAADPRIRVVPGPARGIAAALNVGLAKCAAPLVARMDADDEWLAGRWLAQQQALASNSRLAAVGGGVEIFSEAPLGEGMRHYQSWLDSISTPEDVVRERYVEAPLVHPASTIRRAALLEVGGFRDGEFPEDYALWLALLERGHPLANVSARVLRWGDSGSRLTRTDARYSQAAHAALKAEHLSREPFVKRGVRIAGAGPTGLRLARLLASRGVKTLGFIDVHPRKVGQLIDGIRVDGYESLGAPDDLHLLVAVGAKGVRAEVRDFLVPRGWVETRDFTCVS